MSMHRSVSRRWSATRAVKAGVLALAAVAILGPTLRGQAPGAAAPLDQILKQLSTYDGGIESAAVWKLRDYVYARKDDAAGRAECEGKILPFLKSPATPAAKMIAARYLRVIATENAVPMLLGLVADERLADLAIYSLQQIPGGAAERALIQGAGAATGTTKIALVTALGERKAVAAVPLIAPLLQQPALASTAATALGRIGGEAATSALAGAFAAAPAQLKPSLASSLLACAETALAANDRPAALRAYEAVWAEASLPMPLRKAALKGRIVTAGAGAEALVLNVLAGSDADLQEAAISTIAAVISPEAVAPVCASMTKLPDRAKVQLLAVLSSYPGGRVAPAVIDQLASPTVEVRLAALKTLGLVGGADAVAPLAEAAARARGAEQVAARAALGALKGRAVDDEIVAQLARKPADATAGELILTVGDRRIFPARATVAAALMSTSPLVRANALRALRGIGTPSDTSAVLDLLLKTDSDSERVEAEKTAVALAQMIENPDGRSRFIKARLAGEKQPASRVRLIAVLPLVADPSALPVLRALVDDEQADVFDAAVRAMAAWPTPAAREDLLELARDSRSETHRLLAIRGLVRVVGLDRYRDVQASVADLRQAAGFAWRPEEQKLVLGALAQFPCRDALDLATGFLREPSVKAEAKAAVDRIAARLKESNRK